MRPFSNKEINEILLKLAIEKSLETKIMKTAKDLKLDDRMYVVDETTIIELRISEISMAKDGTVYVTTHSKLKNIECICSKFVSKNSKRGIICTYKTEVEGLPVFLDYAEAKKMTDCRSCWCPFIKKCTQQNRREKDI